MWRTQRWETEESVCFIETLDLSNSAASDFVAMRDEMSELPFIREKRDKIDWNRHTLLDADYSPHIFVIRGHFRIFEEDPAIPSAFNCAILCDRLYRV